ncbi:MAG: hypothetical protein ACPGXK_16795 [Phycisphaerae bacterium]
MYRRTLAAALTGMLVLATTTPASAGNCRYGEVEIDSVRASLRSNFDGYRLNVRYDVELENLDPSRYVLLVNFSERGRLLRDHRGYPLEVVADFLRPTDVDDGEYEFKDRFSLNLSRCAVQYPRHLKVHAKVVDRYNGSIVARKWKWVRRW